jgi:protein-arginine kinase activator protein McsA
VNDFCEICKVSEATIGGAEVRNGAVRGHDWCETCYRGLNAFLKPSITHTVGASGALNEKYEGKYE